MPENHLTIVIPTRERADTLIHSLRTCTTQDYDNLSIVISDNFSSDNTREIVNSFNDRRIQYVNTGKRLSMSENYEFGLSQVKDGYACILGDDDGMLPGSIVAINEVIENTGFEAVNWRCDQYLWPSFRFNKRANLLKISLDDSQKLCSGSEELQNLIHCKNGYEIVPWLYKGFVHVNAIEKIKSISGRFFNSMIPDVYSGIALANVIDKYVYSYKPFSLDAISNHSNGASYNMVTDDKVAANKFLSETNLPMHSGFTYNQSAYLLTAESVFQAIDHHVLDPSKYDIDINIFFIAALKEVQHEPESRYENVVEGIRHTANYFKISTEKVRQLIADIPNRPFTEKYNINVEGFNRFKNRVEINADKFGVQNVYDATLLHNQIRARPDKYLTPAAKAKSTAKFVIREIQKRYF